MGDALGLFEQLRDSDGESMSAVFVAGDPAAHIRAVNLAFNGGLRPNLALSAGGPDTSDGELLEHFERLKQVARRLAPESRRHDRDVLRPSTGAKRRLPHRSRATRADERVTLPDPPANLRTPSRPCRRFLLRQE
jgi:hypothetical protein